VPAEGRQTAVAEAQTPSIHETEIRTAVEDWATIWTDQDADRYLFPWAKGLGPADDLNRAPERLRRSRLPKLQWVEVRLDSLTIEDLGSGRAKATFKQTYRFDLYSDVVDKTLELIREGGKWKIVAEIANTSQ